MYIRKDSYKLIKKKVANSFEVDDLIAPAISLLNQKGYLTTFCCSGHVNIDPCLERAYIAFEFGVITPEFLPEGWSWICDDQMEYIYKSITMEKIVIVMSDLLSWAKELPDATN